MSAGKVVFHSAIQPTKKMLLEQYETLENAAYGKLKWRTSDWVRVLGSLCVRVCACYLHGAFLRHTDPASWIRQKTEQGRRSTRSDY